MARKHHFSRLCAVFLLFALLLTLIATPLYAAEDDVSSMTVAEYVAQIDRALKEALASKASALETAGDTESAAYLRGFSFHAFRIAIVDIYYSQVYVKTHASAFNVAAEMVDLLADNFYLDMLTTPELVTDALVLCYVRTIGDVYASYANEETYVSPEDEETEYVGIGVTVELLTDGYAKVIEVAHGSPAADAGMKLGDVIVAVEGEDFSQLGYDNAVNKIRGEEGTQVTITVKRDDETIDFTMTRKKMTIRTVSYRTVEESEETIGYIRITKFDGTTFSQFVEAVEALEAEEVTSFVFDVRQNPGGRLDVIVAILDYILPDGTGAPIVRLKYRYKTQKILSILDYFSGSEEGVEKYGYTAALNHSIDKKMTVLCDAYTVSAAELFTSCLKDFGVAEVFGSTTYGKGMGQSEITIPYSYTGDALGEGAPVACIRISTFYYSPPVSDNYEGIGVEPHHTVTLPDELLTAPIADLTYDTDEALKAAVAFIESGAPITEGKVDLTPEPEEDPPGTEDGGDSGNNSGNGNNGSGNSGNGNNSNGNQGAPENQAPVTDPSSPSAPAPPTDSEKDPSILHAIAFWSLFSLLAFAVSGLLAIGLYKRLHEKEEDPLFSGDAPPPPSREESDTNETHNLE